MMLRERLEELGQGHLFDGLSAEQTTALLLQAEELDKQLPGGMAQYVATARSLLESAQRGINPLAGCVPAVPTGEKLRVGTPEFTRMETLGAEEIGFCGFVLVAGGLGERLGYPGIKVALPLYIAERDMCYLELYLSHISTMQRQHGKGRQVPVAIMTSDDTHLLTIQLLQKHHYFGMPESQITIMKQNKVPAMLDVSAKFAGKDGAIDTKPHGHGDVHTLLHQHGCVDAWSAAGTKWVVFFQDTNGPIFRAVTAVVGVSKALGLSVNSVCVPRTPGEAVGGICRLHRPDGSQYTINVEYNQLDPLLRSTTQYATGDCADEETGFSPFPGNINCLVFDMGAYRSVLDSTGGSVPEFVNPKYADAHKIRFKSATRLECMMQDLPGLMPPHRKVGFTEVERWLCFSAVKNNLADAAVKAQTGLPAECSGTAERDSLHLNCQALRLAGASIPDSATQGTYAGIHLTMPPLVHLLPSFGTSLSDIHRRFQEGAKLTMTARSSLVLEGDVTFSGRVQLDGALVIKAVVGAEVTVKNLVVSNGGWALVAVSPEEADDEFVRMRGYQVERTETEEHLFPVPGHYTIGA